MFLENSKTIALDFIKFGQSISLSLPLFLYVEALDYFLHMSCEDFFLLICLLKWSHVVQINIQLAMGYVLRFQTYKIMTNICGTVDQTQCLVHTRQAPYQLSFILNPTVRLFEQAVYRSGNIYFICEIRIRVSTP